MVNLKVNLNFFIKQFSHITKKAKTNFKYLKNEKSIYNEIKAFFIIYKELPLKHLKPNFFEAESWTLIEDLCKENLAKEVSAEFS